MSKFFVSSNQIDNDIIKICGTDVNHIKNVLRLKKEDNITICEKETSKNYLSEIIEINDIEVICKIKENLQVTSEQNVEITIFQGLPKSDKMELIIQKGTELGVKEFVPVALKRCIVKLNEKDAHKKIERWNKISEVAAKQCGRDIIPVVKNVENINNLCERICEFDLFLVAYELEKENYIKKELLELKSKKDFFKIAVVVGPEGGLEEDEVKKLQENGAKVITLGNRILRTETVVMQVASIIMYELENGG